MENRYLPILHENISLSVLRVSNESHLTGRMGGENRFECKLFPALGDNSYDLAKCREHPSSTEIPLRRTGSA